MGFFFSNRNRLSRASSSSEAASTLTSPPTFNPFCFISKVGKALSRQVLPQWTFDLVGKVEQFRHVLPFLPTYWFRVKMYGICVGVSSVGTFGLACFMLWYIKTRMQAMDHQLQRMEAELAAERALLNAMAEQQSEQQVNVNLNVLNVVVNQNLNVAE